MASATFEVAGGGGVSTPMGFSFTVSSGAAIAFGAVPWNTSEATRTKVDWLPRADHPIGTCPNCKAKMPMDRLWYGYMRELDKRLGGIHGTPLPTVVTTVQQTQTQVVATSSAITETIAYARSIDAATTAITQVARDNALTGASSIPPTSDPPSGTVTP